MLIADLHVHSKYSRTASPESIPAALDFWARRKGISLVGTGDFTHPAWRAELTDALVPAEEGLYTLKEETIRPGAFTQGEAPRFVVSGEISSIYKKNGKVHKVHNLIILPGLEAATALSHRLGTAGSLHSDGRPTLSLNCRDLLEITLETVPNAIFIPSHIWTPHFSLFGSFSGFDTIEDCFEDLTPYIYALETGHSSDPPMNWRWSALDRYHMVSSSDAHTPNKLGREATVLDIPLSYPALEKALRTGRGLKGTVELFPQTGSHYYDGHRRCHQCLSPQETKAADGRCPVCGKALTIGALHRLEALCDRPQGYVRPRAPQYERLIPLPQVLCATLGGGENAKRNQLRYEELLLQLGPELYILREAPLDDIARIAGPSVAEGIRRLRAGEVQWQPGYDGESGAITLLSDTQRDVFTRQVNLFTRDMAKGSSEKKAAAPSPDPEQALEEDSSRGLNLAQLSAVQSTAPTLAVVAGPGTGKTKVLFSRILWLIQTQGVRPSEITVITFTRKAADTLRTQLETRLGGRRFCRGLTIGTVHSISLGLLSKDGAPVRLVGEYEAQTLAGQALRSLEVKASPAMLLKAVSQRKNGLSPEDQELEGACDFYMRRLQERGLTDFDDLLHNTLEQWEGKSRSDARKFRHLLVDDFQDCNPMQYRLIKAWNRIGRSLFVTGDPDQAICTFPGTSPPPFTQLKEEFPGLVTLSFLHSYRSTPEILGCALAVLAPKENRTGVFHATRRSGCKVRLLQGDNEKSEATFIAKEIGRLVRGEHTRSFSDLAVCYRSRHQTRVLEQCLKRENIPYVVAGKGTFLRDDIVRGALCFFRLLLDPADMLSLEGCLRLVWNISSDLARSVADTWERTPGSAAQRVKVVDAAYDQVSILRPWLDLTAFFGEQASWELPDRLLERWTMEAGCTGSEALEQLQNTAVFYKTMPELLEGLALGGEGDLWGQSGPDCAAGAVTLMPLHAAKGLEFPVVFICSLCKGILPRVTEGRIADEGEERRLFYVGMTRAQEELILLTSGAPSPFLADLPTLLLEQGDASPQRKDGDHGQISLFG